MGRFFIMQELRVGDRVVAIKEARLAQCNFQGNCVEIGDAFIVSEICVQESRPVFKTVEATRCGKGHAWFLAPTKEWAEFNVAQYWVKVNTNIPRPPVPLPVPVPTPILPVDADEMGKAQPLASHEELRNAVLPEDK